jgi:signal transduction histidine kinase
MRPAALPRWRHALGHSIQRRLVAGFVLLALCTSAVFVFGMQRVLANGWQAYAKPMVADYVDRLAADIGSPPSVARAQALAATLPITVHIQGPSVQWDSRGSRPDRAQRREHADETGEDWGLVRETADGHRISFGLARAPSDLRPRLIGWATLAMLLMLTAIAFTTVRRLLAPLRPIAAGVAAFGQGDFTQPIVVNRRDELGALAQHINGMAANLSGMLDAKRALLLAISHELRSPLTRARINAELVEAGPERAALLRDLGEMRDLITDLLESERLAQGHAALQPEPTDLTALVHEVLAANFPGAALALSLPADMQPQPVDPARLRLLLRNLISNALRHSPPGAAPPQVFLRNDAGGQLALGVRDYGAGVPAAQLAELGQAFYRPDSARTRSGGGVGLGLYLCRLVAQAHGGTLRLRNAEPGLEACAVWRAA